MLLVSDSLTLAFTGQTISFKGSTRLRMKLLRLSSGFIVSRASMVSKNSTVSKNSMVSRALSSGSHRKWNVLKLHHVAIATPAVDTAANFYRDVLGTNVSVWRVSISSLLVGKYQ